MFGIRSLVVWSLCILLSVELFILIFFVLKEYNFKLFIDFVLFKSVYIWFGIVLFLLLCVVIFFIIFLNVLFWVLCIVIFYVKVLGNWMCLIWRELYFLFMLNVVFIDWIGIRFLYLFFVLVWWLVLVLLNLIYKMFFNGLDGDICSFIMVFVVLLISLFFVLIFLVCMYLVFKVILILVFNFLVLWGFMFVICIGICLVYIFFLVFLVFIVNIFDESRFNWFLL